MIHRSRFRSLTTLGLLNCIRALGGYTIATSPDNIFDTEEFVESEYSGNLASLGRMPPITLNWYEFGEINFAPIRLTSFPRYNGFKVIAYFCLGYVAEAAEQGFFVYETRNLHPKCVLPTAVGFRNVTDATQS